MPGQRRVSTDRYSQNPGGQPPSVGMVHPQARPQVISQTSIGMIFMLSSLNHNELGLL